MASSKGLPAHLAAARQRDSNDKLARVKKLRDKIKADAKAGRLTRKYVNQLGLASFCLEAGVSENYLNGKRLREGIKPEIKALIAKLKRQMNEAASEELNPDGASIPKSYKICKFRTPVSRACCTLQGFNFILKGRSLRA
jgi:hypothetical protein